MHQPGFEWTGNAAGQFSPLSHRGHDVGVAAGYMAEQCVGMAVRRLGVGRDHDVGAEIQRPLAVGRHGGVVGHHDRARRMGRRRHRRDVADVEPGIGRGLDEHEAVTVEAAVEIGRGRAQIEAIRQAASGSARPAPASCSSRPTATRCGRRSSSKPKNTAAIAAMPDGKATARRIFEMAEHLFHGIPGRIVVAAVLADAGGIAGKMEGRGHRERQRHRVALGKFLTAQMGKAGGARSWTVGHGFCLCERMIGFWPDAMPGVALR